MLIIYSFQMFFLLYNIIRFAFRRKRFTLLPLRDHLHNKKWIYFPTNLTFYKVILQQQEANITGIDINLFIHHKSLYEKLGNLILVSHF